MQMRKNKTNDKNDPQIAQNAKSAYLMEYTSGKVIYAKNEKAKLYPASMTKMMGLLLILNLCTMVNWIGKMRLLRVHMLLAWEAVRYSWKKMKP